MTTDEIVRVAKIDGRVEAYDWGFAREAAARIDAHWAAQCRLKPGLFDGRVLLAHEWSIDGDMLVARYFETNFRNFLSWRDFGFPGAPIANCFAMAALRASDGAFMLGEMGAGTANGGKLYFPAGTPDPSDIVPGGAVDLEGSAVRELEEETGVLPGDVELDDGWTIVPEGPLVACMKTMRTVLTAEALQASLGAFNAGQAEPELARLVPVSSEADFDRVRMPAFMVRYLTAALGA